MNTVFSFSYNGDVYYALTTEKARAAVSGSNAVSELTVLSNEDLRATVMMESANHPSSLSDVPSLYESNVKMDEGFYVITGKLNVNGEVYLVSVDRYKAVFESASTPATAVQKAENATEPANGFFPLNIKFGTGKKQAGICLSSEQTRAAQPHRLTVNDVLKRLTTEELYELYGKLEQRFGAPAKKEEPKTMRPKPEPHQPAEHEEVIAPPSARTAFLESLKPEVAATLQDVPLELIRKCAVSVSKNIDFSTIAGEGEEYCQANNWQMCRDYYAIDNIKTMERYFYSKRTGTFTAIPIQILQKWRRIISE